MAPKKVYLHIGLHKTGTTYLQNVFRANREQLDGEDVDFPGAKGEPVQALAVLGPEGRRPRGVTDRRMAGSWQRLVEHVNASSLPTALISEERISLATLKQVVGGRLGFPGERGARHRHRARPRSGRRVVLAGGDQELTDLDLAAVRRGDQRPGPGRDQSGARLLAPAGPRGDLRDLGVHGPVSHLHVVTVPPSGSSSDELLRRFASVVGSTRRR